MLVNAFVRFAEKTGALTVFILILVKRKKIFAFFSFYEGEVAKGKRHGFGTFKSTAGTSYTGEWSNGKREGKVCKVFN